jgi:hypothetical protein
VGDKEAQGARAAPSLIEIVGGFLDMKKLIVLSVIFALVAGSAFAVDLGGVVIGDVTLASDLNGESDDVTTSGKIGRVRIEGSGANDDGTFGGWFRANNGAFFGHAWWKPIDQLKLQIGGNGGDGYFGKDGIVGYGWYAQVMEIGNLSVGGDLVWYNTGGYHVGNDVLHFRNAFYGGNGGKDDLILIITPADMATINITLPFGVDPDGNRPVYKTTEDVLKHTHAQVDLNFDFGNIALTYVGGAMEAKTNADRSKIFVSYAGGFGDINLEVGLAYTMAGENAAGDSVSNPLNVGLGLKYSAEAFGVKFRAMGALPADSDKTMYIYAEVMPFFNLSDSLTAFVSGGFGMAKPDSGDSVTSWHFNPYIRIGEEWGTSFYAGILINSNGKKNTKGDTYVNWAVPIGIVVNF